MPDARCQLPVAEETMRTDGEGEREREEEMEKLNGNESFVSREL